MLKISCNNELKNFTDELLWYFMAFNHKSKAKTWNSLENHCKTTQGTYFSKSGRGQHFIYSFATCSVQVKAIVMSVYYDAQMKA